MSIDIQDIAGKTAQIEKRTFTVVPFSPVFIGSGDNDYKGIDFFSRKNVTCRFHHQKIYAEFLEELDALEQALAASKLDDFLTERGKRLTDYTKQQWRGDVQGRDLAVPLTDGFGNPLLPGSSLKGSIKTALFADFFRQQEISARDYGKWISGRKVGDRELNKRILTTYTNNKRGNPPNYDIGRALRITDATFKQKNLEVFNTVIANETSRGYRWKKFGRGPKNTGNLEEATRTSLAALSYDEGTTDPVPFSISIDRSVLKHIDWRQPFTFKTIADACNRLAEELIELELTYLEEAARDLKELQPVIREYGYLLEDVKASMAENKAGEKINWFQRVGWGAGWLGMTGAHAYGSDDTGREYMDILREKAGFMFKRTGDFIYPKTRKVVLDRSGKPAICTGWIYVEMSNRK